MSLDQVSSQDIIAIIRLFQDGRESDILRLRKRIDKGYQQRIIIDGEIVSQ